jgi:hypothetical protein
MDGEDLPQEGEDLLAWTMRTKRMSFPEAVEYLAQFINEPAPVPEED